MFRSEASAWVAKDEGSSNGTTLDERPLARGQLAMLDDGDRLVLGRAVVVRPMFTPWSLYRFLRASAAGYPGVRPAKQTNVDLLARAICQLGSATEAFNVEYRVRAGGASTNVRVTIERSLVDVIG